MTWNRTEVDWIWRGGRPRRRAWIASISILAVVVTLALSAYYLQTSPSPAPTDPESTPPSAPPFTRWLQFEPDDYGPGVAVDEYFVDAVLGHQVFRVPPSGLPRHLARQLLLDDDRLLLSSGRRLWNRQLLHQPGLAGEFCYLHSTYCLDRLFDVTFTVDGNPVVVYDNQYQIERYPSHTTVRYVLPGVTIAEHKFITYDDRAVAAYTIRSRDQQPHEVTLEVLAPYLPLPGGGEPPSFPRFGSGSFQELPLFLYLDAPGFERIDAPSVHLQRRLEVPANDQPVSTTIAFRFDNARRDTPDLPLGADPVVQHAREYNRWFAEHVPYFDSSDPAFKKMWYYRWWIVRFHLVEAETADLSGYAFYKGKLGFDNPIGFAVPVQVKELTYLRDPRYALSQIENTYRNRARNGAIIDPPGKSILGRNVLALDRHGGR